MLRLCRATAGFYDRVYYTSDAFDPRQPADIFRARVADRQSALDRMLRETAAQAGLTVTNVPRGLTTAERVAWISVQLAATGLLPVPPAQS
jgi:hypothetical protein